MGFIFDPDRRAEAQTHLLNTMLETKYQFRHALPFAMDPVVYDFSINQNGTDAEFLSGKDSELDALMTADSEEFKEFIADQLEEYEEILS